MRGPGEPAAAANDRHLFYVAQGGLREVAVAAFVPVRDELPGLGAAERRISGPSASPGAGYVVGGALLRPASAQRIARSPSTCRPDKARYAPGDEVTLRVRTRGPDGRAMPATVVLSAVDEKLYTIGAASPGRPAAGAVCLPWCRDPSHLRLASDTSAARRRRRHRRRWRTTTSATPCCSRRSTPVRTGAARSRSAYPQTSPPGTSAHRPSGPASRRAREPTLIPVGLPFFVDASIAPEYLLADRPAIQIRVFGTALDPSGPGDLHGRRRQSRAA